MGWLVGFSQSTVIFNETFESDGNGIRYFQNHDFTRFPGAAGQRGTTATFTDPFVFAGSGRLNTSGTNNFYTGVRLSRDLANPIDSGYIETRWIQVTNYDSLEVGIDLAANPDGFYDSWDRVLNRDWLDVDYEIDNSGTWVNVLKFRAGPGLNVPDGQLFWDENRDNFITGGVETVVIDSFFRNFSTLIGVGITGDSIRFRVNMRSTYLYEDFIVDNMRLRGTPGFVIPSDVPRIIGPNCGFSTTNLQDKVWVQPVAGALSYDFRMTMGATQEIVNYTQNRCVLENFPSIVYDTVITMDVRAITAGGPSDWYSAYYATCQTTIGNAENPSLTGAFCNQTITSASQKITFNRVGLATNYLIRVTRGATVVTDSTNSIWGEFRLTDFGFNFGGSYFVEIAAKIGGVWQSFNGGCNLTVNSGDIQMVPCGITLTNANKMVFCQSIPNAVWYRFRINGPGITNLVIQTTNNGFRFSDLSGYSYGNTYAIEVAYRVTFGSSYGPPCNVVLDAPSTSVVNQQCGGSVADGSELVHFFYVPEFDSITVNYSGPISGSFTSTNTNNFRFSSIPGATAGSYNITVEGYLGGVGQGVGPSCSVNLLSFPQGGGDSVEEPGEVISSDEIEFNVYPVPFTNILTLVVEDPYSESDDASYYQLMDKSGNVVESGSFDHTTKINTIGLESGVYLIKLIQGDQIEVRRILKQ